MEHRTRAPDPGGLPVAIFRFAQGDGPGRFALVLEERRIPQRLVRVDAGDAIPTDPRAFAGIALMGGPMSVNDDLPWIPPVLDLVRRAVDADVPVIGHCLGGQLMSKALGGVVSRNPVWEIGWRRVEIAPGPDAERWFGELRGFDSFHWHGETFTIPAGATRIASSDHCANQAFAVGPHLAMQCHVEMTESIIDDWTAEGKTDITRHAGPAVQSPATIRAEVTTKLPALARVATGLYDRWLANVAR